MSSSYSSVDWGLSHWAHYTVYRFISIYVVYFYISAMHVYTSDADDETMNCFPSNPSRTTLGLK